MSALWTILKSIQFFPDVIDIILVGLLFFLLFSLLRETRSYAALRGLMIILIASFFMFFVAKFAQMSALRLIFERFWIVTVLVFLIVFQNEFRKALTDIGQIRLFRAFFTPSGRYLDEIIKAVMAMSSRNVGALIAIERRNPLRPYVETGVPLDAVITAELLRTIFAPVTPLHDGAVIIRNEKVAAAGCILPLSIDPAISKELGTRHRASLGLSEETDAVVICVSEETGIISLAVSGRLSRGETENTLRHKLESLLDIPAEPEPIS
ncbi:MAG: diadenylate cyclase CdaA [Candidatus Sumerlaeia bacterium]